MVTENVLVVGGGIGGIAAAAALAQRGVNVEVIEILASAGVPGVGINQPGNSLRALRTLDVLDEVLDAGYIYDGNDYRDADDQRIVLVPSTLGGEGVPANCGLTRKDLHRILLRAGEAAGARIYYSTQVSAVFDAGDAVNVTFDSGVSRRYDLVVAFDGVRSPMRRRLLGADLVPRYTGSVVWRKQLPRPEQVTRTILWNGHSAKGGVIPLSETEMYLLLVTQEPERMRADESDLPALLHERLEGFAGPLREIRASIGADTTGIVCSPLVEINVATSWHRGRVIVLGDAVHTAVPHLTQGAAMAIEDAVVLADEVTRERPVEESLQEIERLRRPRTDLVFAASHRILEQEQATTAETLPAVLAGMREHLADQTDYVESVLNEPFRALQFH